MRRAQLNVRIGERLLELSRKHVDASQTTLQDFVAQSLVTALKEHGLVLADEAELKGLSGVSPRRAQIIDRASIQRAIRRELAMNGAARPRKIHSQLQQRRPEWTYAEVYRSLRECPGVVQGSSGVYELVEMEEFNGS